LAKIDVDDGGVRRVLRNQCFGILRCGNGPVDIRIETAQQTF
jgi:hypothetical protein